MNTRLWLGTTVMILACLSSNAQAQGAAVDYEYGQKLDIAKVISLSEPDTYSSECNVVTAHMVYLDSAGQRHALNYLKLPDICSHWG